MPPTEPLPPSGRSALRSGLLPAAVVAAVVLGIVARFLTTSPLWLDEALSVNIASLPVGDIPDALRHDGHPPLYYWLLHGWMSLFGDGDVAVRALSGLLSVATLPLAWAAGRRMAGRGGAAWAVVVLALSPFAVRYATEARMYALVMFLVAAGYVVLARVLSTPRTLDVVLLAGIAAALLWTHYWALYLIAATGGLLVMRWWRQPARRRATLAAASAIALGSTTFVAWLGVFVDQAAHTGTPWASPSRPTTIVDVTLADLGGGGFAEARLYGIAVVVLVLLAAFARPSARAGAAVELGDRVVPLVRDELVVVGTALALGTLAGYAAGGAYASRYASVVVPVVLLVAAIGLTRLSGGWLRWGLSAALLGLAVVGIAHNAVDARTQVQDLGDTIAAGASPGDVVVACPDQLGPSLERALRGVPVEVVPYPAGGDPRFVDWRDYAQRNADADPVAFAEAAIERAGPGAVWVVWNGSYRTFTEQCETLVIHLGARRSGTILATAGDAFEPANLHRFG